MKYLLCLILILGLSSFCYADRVCIEKATGKLIEYQSGGSVQSDLDVMVKNAVNSGYNPNDVEAKFVTQSEWKAIEKQWAKDPAEAKIKDKKDKQKIKRDEVKTEFGWTEAQMQKLEKALDYEKN